MRGDLQRRMAENQEKTHIRNPWRMTPWRGDLQLLFFNFKILTSRVNQSRGKPDSKTIQFGSVW